MFTHFYHGTMRKIVIAFGSIMNNIEVVRKDHSGKERQRIRVPLSYAAKDKLLQRWETDPDISRNVAMILPRMSFEITDLKYQPARKLPPTTRNWRVVSSTMKEKQFTPVPYDVTIRLNVMAALRADTMQTIINTNCPT